MLPDLSSEALVVSESSVSISSESKDTYDTHVVPLFVGCRMQFLAPQVPVWLILKYFDGPDLGIGCVQAISGTGVDMAICTPGRLQVQEQTNRVHRASRIIEKPQ